MDDRRFDRWTLALTERLSRRGLGRWGALAAILPTLGAAPALPEAAEAKKKKKGGKKKKKKPVPVTCTPDCAGGKTCGSNGCPRGSCGTCDNGFVCSDPAGGVCECPSGVTCDNGNACCGDNEQCIDNACCLDARLCGAVCCTG